MIKSLFNFGRAIIALNGEHLENLAQNQGL
jgi:hypothetical protein